MHAGAKKRKEGTCRKHVSHAHSCTNVPGSALQAHVHAALKRDLYGGMQVKNMLNKDTCSHFTGNHHVGAHLHE